MHRSKLRGLLEEHHEDAYRWALHCCGGHREEAKDVLQGTYLTVLEERAPFEGRSSFRTWLFTLIRRGASTARRRWLRRLQLLHRDTPTGRTTGPQGEERIHRSELREQVDRMLSQLSLRQREVLTLVFYHELTVREAAQVMGISVGSARTHYHRGKERLRRQIEEAGLGYEMAMGR